MQDGITVMNVIDPSQLQELQAQIASTGTPAAAGTRYAHYYTNFGIKDVNQPDKHTSIQNICNYCTSSFGHNERELLEQPDVVLIEQPTF